MRTDHLIDLLAQGAEPVPARSAARRLGLALLVGLPMAAVMLEVDYGFRSDLAEVATWPAFWVKLLFPLLIGLAGFLAAERLGRPGRRVGVLGLAFVLPLGTLWLLAGAVLQGLPEAARVPMVLGNTWRSCALNITYLATPIFIGTMLALRSLAPTRPTSAGAAGGALAGGAAAALYALHCPELEAPFLAVWYVAGIALTSLIGALVGRGMLRW